MFAPLFLAVALASSAPVPINTYPDSAKSDKTVVVVRMQWEEPQKVHEICASYSITPVPEDQQILGCYIPYKHLIIATEPKSFNDHYRLMILGHEFWHALGAEHP